jgi:hypothetical protein
LIQLLSGACWRAGPGKSWFKKIPQGRIVLKWKSEVWLLSFQKQDLQKACKNKRLREFDNLSYNIRCLGGNSLKLDIILAIRNPEELGTFIPNSG